VGRQAWRPTVVENVPKAGLEPAQLAPHAPETCVSTNFTTSAEVTRQIPIAETFRKINVFDFGFGSLLKRKVVALRQPSSHEGYKCKNISEEFISFLSLLKWNRSTKISGSELSIT
jgi:hypothetical protein